MFSRYNVFLPSILLLLITLIITFKSLILPINFIFAVVLFYELRRTILNEESYFTIFNNNYGEKVLLTMYSKLKSYKRWMMFIGIWSIIITLDPHDHIGILETLVIVLYSVLAVFNATNEMNAFKRAFEAHGYEIS